MSLANLSDEELLSSLSAVCCATRRLLGRLLLHLIEVEERRLDLRLACSSLFDFCRRRLGMSEGEAVRRIEAARLVRRFPTILGWLERGEIHMTALLLLRDQLTEANVEDVLCAARGKTKRELLELVAARAPRPDVPASLTELRESSPPAPVPLRSSSPSPAHVDGNVARLEPLSPTRHRLELTIGAEVRAKLERARDLMGHRVPDGRLERVLDCALDALLAKLERERLGKVRRRQLESAPGSGGAPCTIDCTQSCRSVGSTSSAAFAFASAGRRRRRRRKRPRHRRRQNLRRRPSMTSSTPRAVLSSRWASAIPRRAAPSASRAHLTRA